MKLISSTIVFFAVFSNLCFSQEPITRVHSPIEVRTEVKTSVPRELEGLQWNRWTSKNFVVCSLNDTQAQYLHKHLEFVKGWVFARWGLFDVDFSAECKLICVDNPALFKKLFNLDTTRVEIRRDTNGKIKESVIFMLLDGNPSQTVPIPLTEVCLAEFAQKYNTSFSLWGIRGMSLLNGSLDQIRVKVNEMKPLLDKNEPVFFTKGIIETTQEQYAKMNDDKKKLYDRCAMLLCLMVRKEFGQEKYLKLLKASSEGKSEQGVSSVLKFKGYSHFDSSFKRFMTDIVREGDAGRIPDSYLQINEKK